MARAPDELAFARIKAQWWWFDPKHESETKNRKAWAWEFLRRTSAYQEFHRRASAIPKPRAPKRPARGTPQRAATEIFGPVAIYNEQIRHLAYTHLPLGNLDPARSWGELFLSDDECAPSLSWVELSDESRRRIESLQAIVPRQEKPITQFYPFRIDPVVLIGDSAGREIAHAIESHGKKIVVVPEGSTLNPAVMGKHPSVAILPPEMSELGYIVASFDTRAGEAAYEELKQWRSSIWSQNSILLPADDSIDEFFLPHHHPQWWSVAHEYRKPGTRGATKSQSGVFPSRIQYLGQAWIRADSYRKVEKAFRTLLSPREREKWLPRCQASWNQPEEIKSFGKGKLVHYKPYEDPHQAVKTKAMTHGLKPQELMVGFAAFDSRPIEPKFTASGFLIPFLQVQGSVTDPDLILEAMKNVRKHTERINQLYAL